MGINISFRLFGIFFIILYVNTKQYKYGKFIEISILDLSKEGKIIEIQETPESPKIEKEIGGFVTALFGMSIIDNKLKYLQIFFHRFIEKRTKFSKKGE